jgi:hypothetical protein
MGRPWEHSNQIEWDNNGAQAIGATAEFFAGGTTTPLVVYQDAGEATPHPNPVVADGHGRWPLVVIPFVASYDVRVATAGGTQLYYARELPNLDPIEASVDSVDDTQLIQTGQIIFEPKGGTLAGFVRCNGRTIGSAASGASERANADTAALYEYNWNNFADAILPVTGGRGTSAAADFAANKPIALLDGRSGTLRGTDDMGASAAGLLGAAGFATGNATTGGSVCGANSHTLTGAQLPVTSITPAGSIGPITPAGSISQITPAGTISQITPSGSVSAPTITVNNGTSIGQFAPSATTIGAGGLQIAATTISATASAPAFTGTPTTPTFSGTPTTPTFTGTPVTPSFSGTPASFGSGAAHNNVSKSILGTYRQKL